MQVLATEHWSLLATRSLTYMESFSRVSMFLSVLTGAVVALALFAQVDHFHETFVMAAILILSVVVFVGLATINRILALNRENFRWDLPLDHGTGRFAGPEARDPDPGRQPGVSLVDRGGHLVHGHLDGQDHLGPGPLFGFDLDCHRA